MESIKKYKFDDEGYLMQYCPYCNENISYKYNPDYSNTHPVIKEVTGYQCELTYRCNKVNKLFYNVS